MRQFINIPQAFWPKEDEHIEYDSVYRAVKSESELTIDDFLPWNIEYANQEKTFKGQFAKPNYGMSVFTDMKSLLSKIHNIPSLRKKTKSIAIGRTSIEKGISTRENQEHHVEYYLYDYINNSPKEDFEICISNNEINRMVDGNE